MIDAAETPRTCSYSNRTTHCLGDQQRLIEITPDVGCRDTLRYEHRRAREELFLAIPDAIAWCWARGGTWRQRVEPVVIKRQGV